ncbi:MAG: heavy metal translocating P-type ATPase [Planctomycetes bacterium]|nr:heavy metal translocating P-type ATPase [Planctomycetota bacterium]
MTVDPATAAGSHVHRDQTYHFCSLSCLKKFQSDPEKFLGGHREAMKPPVRIPMAARYICPMDPEVVSDKPGACPKCGMALEPAVASAEPTVDHEQRNLEIRLWIGLILGIPVFLLAMLDMLPSRPMTRLFGLSNVLIAQWVLSTLVVFGCGWPFFVRAVVSLRLRSANMFTLIALGTGAAYLYSVAIVLDFLAGTHLFHTGLAGHGGMVDPYFESAAAIIVLVLAGQVLETRARRKTGDAVRSLLKLAPKTARLVLPDGQENDIAVELLQPGDRVRVRPGERLPVDGFVRDGSTHIDESMLTGEPVPVSKSPGESVSAGTLNGNGPIVVEAMRTGGATLLARIVELVATAQRGRLPVQALVDRVAAWFVPAVLVAAGLTFLIWVLFGGSDQRFTLGLINAVAVLIIACPCALGLATPMAVIVGMGRGAASGVLFRDAEVLERLGHIDLLVMDKTGTLTLGRPVVTNVEPAEGHSLEEVHRLAAGLERGSEHPLAAAIVKHAEASGLAIPMASNVTTIPGKGIRGTVENHVVLIGTSNFLQENQVEGEASRRRLEDLRHEAHGVVQIAIDGKYAGLIAVSDPIRESTPGAIKTLQDEGIKLVMLTGDSRTTANAVARSIGLTEVISEVLPADKLEHIKRLKSQGHIVAMAGDGINDAPALAEADVGIAMGTGSDIAIESAAVTLVRSDLAALVEARHLSKAVMRTIRQNLMLAFLYNVLAIPIAAGILVPLGGGLISPIWAAAAMSFSSLSVIGNSLRLRSQQKE